MPTRSRIRPSFGRLAAMLAVAAAGTALAPAHAASLWLPGLRMTIEKPRFTCEHRGVSLSHVAFHKGAAQADPSPLPCCDGQFGCARFLSTDTILHGLQRWHS